MFIKYEILGDKHIMYLSQIQQVKGIGLSKAAAYTDLQRNIIFYINALKEAKNVNIGNIQKYKKLKGF